MKTILKCLFFPIVMRPKYLAEKYHRRLLQRRVESLSRDLSEATLTLSFLERKHDDFRAHVQAYDKKHGTNIMAKKDEQGRFNGERW